MRRIAALVVSALVAGGVASAADMPMVAKAPVAVAPYNWTGWYVGANVGGTWGRSNDPTTTVFSPAGYFNITSVASINATNQSSNVHGFTGGVQAGYNWQTGALVLGVETDFNYFGNRGSNTVTNIYPCCAPTSYTINASVKTDWLFTARPRFGWAVNNWLIYGTGGVAVTNLKGTFTFTDTFASMFETASVSKTKVGWAIGGGAEFAWLNRWSIKGEYLYTSFGSVSTTGLFTGGTPGSVAVGQNNPFTHSVDLKSHTLRLGLNYKL